MRRLGGNSRSLLSSFFGFGCSRNQRLGRTDQMSGGWHGQTAQKPCKSYSSRPYINVGPVRIAFFQRKTVQKSYYSRVYIHVGPVVIAFCSAKMLFLQAVHTCTPCKNSISWRKTVQMSLGLAPLSPSSMLYVLYVLYGRQPAEPPLSAGSLLYVLYVLYGSHKASR